MAAEIIKQVRYFTGPNIYAGRSALVIANDFSGPATLASGEMAIDLAQIDAIAGVEGIAPVASALHAVLDGAARQPQPLPAMLALAAALQEPYSVDMAVGEVIAANGPVVVVAVPSENPQFGTLAWSIAVAAVLALRGGQAPGGPAVAELARLGRNFSKAAYGSMLDMMTLAMARSARRLDIPFYRTEIGKNVLQFGQGCHGRLVEATLTAAEDAFSVGRARNKWATLVKLRHMGLPVLPSIVAESPDEAVAAAAKLDAPVVVKPVATDKGIGITLNLTDPDKIREAWRLAAEAGPKVLVERFVDGGDHRILVIDGKAISCALRVPAQVTGDGVSTVAQLVEAFNADPRRGIGYEKMLERVKVDQRVVDIVAGQGLAMDSVPAAGRAVLLSLAGNISQGGTAVDMTDRMHPDNIAAAERAARAIGLKAAGIDFFTPDIAKSWREGTGWILEVNSPPGLRPQWLAHPDRDITSPIVRTAFPEGAPVRIPTAGVTGSEGKTTTCRMLDRIARAAGFTPGVSTTQGIRSGDFQVATGDWSSGAAATRLLTDPTIDFGVFEFARGALLKSGLGIDEVDVAAVLNLLGNHVGLDGIETIEDMARVKSIVAKAARKAVVLNADDPLVLAMRDTLRAREIALVSLDPGSPDIVRHREAGGLTAVLDGGWHAPVLRIARGAGECLALPLADIPASQEGTSRAVATNALFAAAMALLMDIDAETVAAGLRDFTSDVGQNIGRHNWIEGLPFALMLHWADSEPAMRELTETLGRRPFAERTHLYFTVVGDRSNEWIRSVARAAAGHFDVYHCAEDVRYLRGRQSGEVPAILAETLQQEGVPAEATFTHIDSENGLRDVFSSVLPGERLIVLGVDEHRRLRQIDEYRASLQKPAG